MPFDVTTEERFWLLTAVGGALAWLGRDLGPKLLGVRRRRRRNVEEENDRLRASLAQAIATIEVLLVVMELPVDRRHPSIERAKKLAAEAKAILNVGQPAGCPPGDTA